LVQPLTLFLLYEQLLNSGICKCEEGCAFLQNPFGCFEIGTADPCFSNQIVRETGPGLGQCECIPNTVPLKGRKGCEEKTVCKEIEDLGQSEDGYEYCKVKILRKCDNLSYFIVFEVK